MKLYKIPKIVQSIRSSMVWTVKTSEKEVFLTFDDGPNPGTTEWILQTLDEFDVKATFFCVGDNVKKHPGLFNELKNRGHVVANHTFNHIYGWNIKPETYLENVQKCSEYIDSRLFRPPHGMISKKQAEILQSNNYIIVMWSLLSYDFSQKIDLEVTLNKCYKNTENGSVVVFHDSNKSIENLKYILPKYLDNLKNSGYTASLLEEDTLVNSLL